MQQQAGHFSNLAPPPYGRPKGAYFHGLLSTPDCASCPLKYDTKILPDGPVPARIAFVGEEGGQTEAAEGRAFIGPSGQLLWQIAESIGLKREDVWVTNSALCISRRIKLYSGAILPHLVVKAMAAKACRQRLVQEILAVDPAVIVPLGNWALWSLSDIPNSRIYAYRGSIIDVDLNSFADLIAKGLAKAPMKNIKEI
jgi:uracil-DNA glycosylase family 4